MDKNILLEFIREKGYRTRTEIGIHFGKEDQEILDIHLKAHVDKGVLREVRYRTDGTHGTLYYVPYHKEG